MWASGRGREGRHDQQAADDDGGTPFARDAHVVDAASRADDHRLTSSEQQAQAFALHRRLEASDDWDAGIAHRPGKVIGLQNEVAGAAVGAEQSRKRLVEQAEIALRVDFRQ